MIDCALLAHIARLTVPADIDALIAAQNAVACTFPQQYVELLRCSNGLSVHAPTAEVWLYAADELEERNSTYEVTTYAPGLLMIGDDGGGNGILLDRSTGAVCRIGMGSMHPDDAIPLAESLERWIDSGFDLKREPVSSLPGEIDVYIVQPPSGGVRTLMKLRKELTLALSVSEVRLILEHLPYRLLRAAPYQPYAWICARLNREDACLALCAVDAADQSIPFPVVE